MLGVVAGERARFTHAFHVGSVVLAMRLPTWIASTRMIAIAIDRPVARVVGRKVLRHESSVWRQLVLVRPACGTACRVPGVPHER